MSETRSNAPEKITGFQLVMLALCLYVVGALSVETFWRLPAETVALLDLIDTLVCFVFLADFGVRFFQAENKRAFMQWGWIDLISSLPNLSWLRWGRLARVFRLLRLLRGFRSLRVVMHTIFRNRVQGTLATAALVMAGLVIFCSIAGLNFETAPNATIRTGDDALWWSLMTITTVGSADKYPVSPEGRVIAILLATAGAGLIGVFAGFMVTTFLNPTSEQQRQNAMAEELRLLREQITRLEGKLDERIPAPLAPGGPPTKPSAPLNRVGL